MPIIVAIIIGLIIIASIIISIIYEEAVFMIGVIVSLLVFVFSLIICQNPNFDKIPYQESIYRGITYNDFNSEFTYMFDREHNNKLVVYDCRDKTNIKLVDTLNIFIVNDITKKNNIVIEKYREWKSDFWTYDKSELILEVYIYVEINKE